MVTFEGPRAELHDDEAGNGRVIAKDDRFEQLTEARWQMPQTTGRDLTRDTYVAPGEAGAVLAGDKRQDSR